MNIHMIKGFAVVAILGAALYGGWLVYEDFLTQGQRPPEGTQILNQMEKEGVPDFTLKNLEGEEVSLSDFDDKVIILNFWASWCAPCVEEFPSLMNLIEEYKEDIVLVAVSADYNEKDLRAFLKAFGGKRENMIVLWDKDQKVATQFGTEILPESYIIAPDLKLVRKIVGVDDWDTPDAFAFFKDLIAKTRPSGNKSEDKQATN